MSTPKIERKHLAPALRSGAWSLCGVTPVQKVQAAKYPRHTSGSAAVESAVPESPKRSLIPVLSRSKTMPSSAFLAMLHPRVGQGESLAQPRAAEDKEASDVKSHHLKDWEVSRPTGTPGIQLGGCRLEASPGPKFPREDQTEGGMTPPSTGMRIAQLVIQSCVRNQEQVPVRTYGRYVVAMGPDFRAVQQCIHPEQITTNTKLEASDWLSPLEPARFVESQGRNRGVGTYSQSCLQPIPIDSPPTSGSKGRDGAAHTSVALQIARDLPLAGRLAPRTLVGRGFCTMELGEAKNKTKYPSGAPKGDDADKTGITAGLTRSGRRVRGWSRMALGSYKACEDRNEEGSTPAYASAGWASDRKLAALNRAAGFLIGTARG